MDITEKLQLIKYPILLKPFCREFIWGGTKLISDYNKKYEGKTLSETWEISVNDDFPSIIDNGEYKGLALAELIVDYPEILGKQQTEFTLLIKFIDSAKTLSVQVHPDDAYAFANEGELGKTEAWYILDCVEGAYIYLGFKEKITIKQYEEYIMEGNIDKYLNKIFVKKGDSFVVEAGTVHSIGAGITLLEIQENSSITYRAYDYKRVDVNGKERDLHIDKALAVTNLNAIDIQAYPQFDTYIHGRKVKVIAMCNYFTSYLVEGGLSFGFEEPTLINIIEGKGCVISKGESIDVEKGDSVFVIAGLSCRIMGSVKFILTIEGDK